MPVRILITGATGGLGSNVLARAVARGLSVRALVRDPTKVKALPGDGSTSSNAVELVRGDARAASAVRRAASGCDALFHLVNVNIHQDWVKTTAQLLESALSACVDTGARLVFPANVWVF